MREKHIMEVSYAEVHRGKRKTMGKREKCEITVCALLERGGGGGAHVGNGGGGGRGGMPMG